MLNVLNNANRMASKTKKKQEDEAINVIDQEGAIATNENSSTDLSVQIPDIDANKKLLLEMLRRKKQDSAKKAKAEARTAELKKELEKAPSNLASASLEELTALQEDANFNLHMEEYLETEQVIFITHPEEPNLQHLNDDLSTSLATSAASSLGINVPYLSTKLDEYPPEIRNNFVNTLFRESLIAGLTASQITSTKTCNEVTMTSLFDCMAYSSKPEVSGAAFYTLLHALGVNEEHTVLLDAVPPPSTLFTHNNHTTTNTTDIKLESIFSTSDILTALKTNGYNPKGASSSSSNKNNKTTNNDNDNDGDNNNKQQQSKRTDEDVRIYSIKLLLHITVALCHHCQQHPTMLSTALPRDATAELLVAILHMHLDPCALRLQPDLLAATSALIDSMDGTDWERKVPFIAEKLSTLGPSHHARLRILKNIPVNEHINMNSDSNGISGSSGSMKNTKNKSSKTTTTNKSTTTITVISRAMELRQRVGCLILEKIIPQTGPFKQQTNKKVSASNLSGSKRHGPPPNPSEVIAAQPWFTMPKHLIQGASLVATSGTATANTTTAAATIPPSTSASSPTSASYTISDVEVLLQMCHLLLWPYLLRLWSLHQDVDPVIGVDQAALDADICSVVLKSEFVSEWILFLSGIRRNVKGLQPEEQSVRALANQLEMEYKSFVSSDGLM